MDSKVNNSINNFLTEEYSFHGPYMENMNQSEISAPLNSTNTSASVGPQLFPVPRNVQIGVTIFAVAIFIVALIGNSVVLYIVCTVNHMRNSTNILIANMAVADLFMTIDIPYILKWFYVMNLWFGTVMGDVLCTFLHSAQVVSLAASTFSLVAISLDRSFAILFPMKTIMTRNVVRFTILITWLSTLALTLPAIMASKNRKKTGTDTFVCGTSLGWELENISEATYMTALFLFGYLVPLLIIAILYCLAGLRLWSRKVPGHRNLMSNKKAKSTSRRATAMLITVVIVFALSWLPWQALEMIKMYNPKLIKTKVPPEIRMVTPWLGYANSAINPILYVIFSENYRQEFYRVLCRGPSRKDRYRKTIISRSTTRSTRTSRTSSLVASIPMQKLRDEANHRRDVLNSP